MRALLCYDNTVRRDKLPNDFRGGMPQKKGPFQMKKITAVLLAMLLCMTVFGSLRPERCRLLREHIFRKQR